MTRSAGSSAPSATAVRAGSAGPPRRGASPLATAASGAAADAGAPRLRWSVGLVAGLLLLYAAHWVIYRPALEAKPSADDYIIPVALRLAESLGSWHFFVHSPLADYRPAQYIVASMAAGRSADPFAALHALSLACFVPYAAVFLLWTRRLGLGRLATWAAFAFLCLHPLLVGPVAELDGFPRTLVSAVVWLGVYLADRYADRLPLALVLTAGCLAVGLLFMEYAVGLLLLAPIAVFCRRQQRRIASALLTVAVLCCVLGVYLWVRSSVVGAGDPLISLHPLVWARNVGMLAVAGLFFGNTAEVAAAPGGRAATQVALASLVVLCWIALGVRARLGSGRPAADGGTPCLALLVPASFAPMFAMEHVSEIYATAPLFALGLLVGWAAEGWSGLRQRWAAFLVLVVLLAWGAHSAAAKVEAIRGRGARAAAQAASLVEAVADQPMPGRIALVFPERGRSYSVFLGGDELLIQPGRPARHAAEWLFPGRNVQLKHVIGREADVADADLVLCWDPAAARFVPAGGGPCRR